MCGTGVSFFLPGQLIRAAQAWRTGSDGFGWPQFPTDVRNDPGRRTGSLHTLQRWEHTMAQILALLAALSALYFGHPGQSGPVGTPTTFDTIQPVGGG